MLTGTRSPAHLHLEAAPFRRWLLPEAGDLGFGLDPGHQRQGHRLQLVEMDAVG